MFYLTGNHSCMPLLQTHSREMKEMRDSEIIIPLFPLTLFLHSSSYFSVHSSLSLVIFSPLRNLVSVVQQLYQRVIRLLRTTL